MIKKTIWLTMALALRSSGQAALLVIFARIGGPERVGTYSLALAITAPIFVLFEFGLRTVYLTHQGQVRFKYYVQVRITTLFLAILASFGIGSIFLPESLITIFLVSLLRAADSMGELYSGPLQKYEALPPILRAYGINTLLTVVTAIALTSWADDLNLVLVALIGVSSVTTIFLMKRPTDIKLKACEYTSIVNESARKSRKKVIRAGLPTGISWGLLSLLSSLPQYFLAVYFTEAEVGFFAIVLYVVVVAEIFFNAVSQSWIPKAISILQKDKNFLKETLFTGLRWTIALIPVSIGAAALAYFFIPIVFGKTYTLGFDELLPLAIAVAVLPTVFFSSMALNVFNSYTLSLAVSSTSVAIAVAACSVLIPSGQVPGALWVIVVGLGSRGLFGYAALAVVSSKRRPGGTNYTGLESR